MKYPVDVCLPLDTEIGSANGSELPDFVGRLLGLLFLLDAHVRLPEFEHFVSVEHMRDGFIS